MERSIPTGCRSIRLNSQFLALVRVLYCDTGISHCLPCEIEFAFGVKIFLPPTYLKAQAGFDLDRSVLLYRLFSFPQLESEREGCADIELLGNKRPVHYGVWRLHNENIPNVAINLGGSDPLAVCLVGEEVSIIAAGEKYAAMCTFRKVSCAFGAINASDEIMGWNMKQNPFFSGGLLYKNHITYVINNKQTKIHLKVLHLLICSNMHNIVKYYYRSLINKNIKMMKATRDQHKT